MACTIPNFSPPLNLFALARKGKILMLVNKKAHTYLVRLLQPHGDFSVLCLADLLGPSEPLDHPLSLPPELVLYAPVDYLLGVIAAGITFFF